MTYPSIVYLRHFHRWAHLMLEGQSADAIECDVGQVDDDVGDGAGDGPFLSFGVGGPDGA